MRTVSLEKILKLEEKLAAAPPEKVAPLVKKLVKLKGEFVHGKT